MVGKPLPLSPPSPLVSSSPSWPTTLYTTLNVSRGVDHIDSVEALLAQLCLQYLLILNRNGALRRLWVKHNSSFGLGVLLHHAHWSGAATAWAAAAAPRSAAIVPWGSRGRSPVRARTGCASPHSFPRPSLARLNAEVAVLAPVARLIALMAHVPGWRWGTCAAHVRQVFTLALAALFA